MYLLIFVLGCIFRVLSILLNAVGIYYLHKLPSFMSNQRILLTNLSLTEIAATGSSFIVKVLHHFQMCDDFLGPACGIPFSIHWWVYFVYLFAHLLLLTDRYIGARWPFEYKDIFSERKVVIAIIGSWIIGLILMTPKVHFASLKKWLEYGPTLAFAFDLCVVLSAIFVYASIAYNIRKGREMLATNCNVKFKASKVPAVIISTFILFVVIPDFIVMMLRQLNPPHGTDDFTHVYQITVLNYFCDPIIYLYGYPPLRSAIKAALLRRTYERKTEDTTE